MVDNLQIATLAGSAATALVSEMTKDGWKKIREIASRLFGYAGNEEAERQLQRLDSDQILALEGKTEEIEGRWNRRLVTFVEDYFDGNPKMIIELRSLIEEARDDSVDREVSIHASDIQGSNFQMGGSNNASINIEGSGK